MIVFLITWFSSAIWGDVGLVDLRLSEIHFSLAFVGTSGTTSFILPCGINILEAVLIIA